MRVKVFEMEVGREKEMETEINSWFSKNPGIDVRLVYTTQGKTVGPVECSWLWVIYIDAEEAKWGSV
jgi:hypothetical protein